MDRFNIYETSYWIVSHRMDSRYPGYLIISSQEDETELNKLSHAALSELGTVLADTEKLLITEYLPCKVIISKLGFTKGFNCHFHIIPVSFDLLKDISNDPKYPDDPDGSDTMLYTSRKYCERPLTELEKETVLKTVNRLRESTANKLLQPARHSQARLVGGA